MAKKQPRKTQEELDKETQKEHLRQQLQALCDEQRHNYISEFIKEWNDKHKDKIVEVVKLGTAIHFKFKDNISILCRSTFMVLG